MLVLLSQEHDLHCDWVEAECDRRGAPWVRLRTDLFPTRVSLTLHPAAPQLAGRLVCDGREIDVDEIVGLWFRRPMPSQVSEDMPRHLAGYAYLECEEAIHGLYRALEDRRWVSVPHRVEAAPHKVHQLQLAARLGLPVVPTLVTNEPERAREFFAACGGEMIYKPLRGMVYMQDGAEYCVYTSRVGADDLERCLDSVRHAPCLFQRLVHKKHELRITVMGERVWTAAIFSQERPDAVLDYRHVSAELRHEPVFLPPRLEAACVEMTHRLGLRSSQIDMIVTPDDEYVFLELNPNGQWAWIEEMTGLPLATALVDELLGVDTLAAHPYVRDRSLRFERQTAWVAPAAPAVGAPP